MMDRHPSAGIRTNLFRPGISLYGQAPCSSLEQRWPLQPVLSLHTEVSFVKTVAAGAKLSYGLTWMAEQPARIATLPVGYGDGYSSVLQKSLHGVTAVVKKQNGHAHLVEFFSFVVVVEVVLVVVTYLTAVHLFR